MKRTGFVALIVLAVIGASILALRSYFRTTASPGRAPASASPQTIPAESAEAGDQDAADVELPVLDSPLEEVAKAGKIPVEEEWGPGLTEEWIDFNRLSGDMLWPDMPMRMEAVIWRAYQMVSTNPAVNVAEAGYKMLSSTSAFVRLTGALWMLEKNGRLDPSIENQLIADPEAFVPLTVLGWMLDSGKGMEARAFDSRWKESPKAWEAAVRAVSDEPLNGMAGRAALWMAETSGWPEDAKRDLASAVAMDEQTDYEIRWQALMNLRRHMDFEEYQNMVDDLVELDGPAGQEPPDRPTGEAPPVEPPVRQKPLTAFDVAMMLLNERISGPPEIMGQTPVLTVDDADLFFAQESALLLENVALWVEAAVDHGAVQVQTGFTDALARYVAEIPLDELPANQVLALRRIQSRMNALRGLERNVPSPE